LGTLAAWALEEGDEEGKQEEIEEEFHTTDTEIEKQNAIDLRYLINFCRYVGQKNDSFFTLCLHDLSKGVWSANP